MVRRRGARRGPLVLRWIQLACGLVVAEGLAGPEGDVATLSVGVPDHAATRPDHAAEVILQLLVVRALGSRARRNRRVAPPSLLDCLKHQADLALDHEDNGVVPEAGVGSEEHEQVREARDHRAAMGLDAVALPEL